jgi:hypothetical protein
VAVAGPRVAGTVLVMSDSRVDSSRYVVLDRDEADGAVVEEIYDVELGHTTWRVSQGSSQRKPARS